MPGLVLFVSVLVLSQSGIFIRTAASHAAAIGFWRMAMALPVLAVILFWRHRGQLRALRSRQWAWLALCGFFLFAHFYTWFLSAQKTSLAHSMILFCSNPLYTALGAWVFFGERATIRHGVALAIAFAGIYVLLGDPSATHSLEGDLLGIACAILFSAYVLVGRGLRRELDNVPFAFVTYSFCALYFFCAMVALGQPFFDHSPAAWASFAALAFGSTLLGHSLLTWCLQHFHVNLVSISTLVEPVFTALSANFLFGEPITTQSLLGFFLVGLGILVLYLPYLRGRWAARGA